MINNAKLDKVIEFSFKSKDILTVAKIDQGKFRCKSKENLSQPKEIGIQIKNKYL